MKKVRTYAKSMKNVEEAVDRAVTECINEGILREFLLQNRKEAVEMSILNMMKKQSLRLSGKMNMRKDIRKEQGRSHCRKAEAILELLEDIGTIPEKVP